MRAILLFTIMTLVTSAAHVWSRDEKPNVDKKADEILKKAAAHLKNAKSIQTSVTMNTPLAGLGDLKVEEKSKGAVVFERPNKFALRLSKLTGSGGIELLSNGKKLIEVNRHFNQFKETDMSDDFAAVTRLISEYGFIHIGPLFRNVLNDDPARALLDGVTKGEYKGLEKIGGKEVHRLRFEQAKLAWEIWIASVGDPWVLRLSITYVNFEGNKETTTETFADWKHNLVPEKSTFELSPSDAAVKVKRFGR